MIKRFQLIQIAVVAMVLLGMFGCSPNQDRYGIPPWLGGSSIETLKGLGNYTIFLKLMDMAGQTSTIEKTLNTMFVPNDSAFNIYLAARGITSIESLTKEEAVELFTLHSLPNPRSRFQLIYEYAFAELQGPNGEYAALFFRKPTSSTSIPYKEVVPEFYPDSKLRGTELTMFTGRKEIPLFTQDYFEDFFGALDGSDYTYMYPDSKWSKVGMNWGNAAVNKQEVRTSNGFLYLVDQVVPPQKNIEQYLIANKDKFGVYYDVLQRFANYATTQTVNGKVQYGKNYDLVSNIAEEQGAFPSATGETGMKDMFTAFLPNNEVMQAYLDRTVLKTYANLDSVPKVTLFYILQTQLSRSLGLISKISQSYFNAFGDPLIITKADIKSAHMCSNGLIYEMNKVLEPNVFTTVPGNLFFDANYSVFLYAMNQSGMIASLSNPTVPVTLFAPNNAEMEAYGIRYDPSGGGSIMYRGKDGKWNKMSIISLAMFVQDHIYAGRLDDLTIDQYVEMSSKNFVHIFNGGLQCSENQRFKEIVQIAKKITPQQDNGILYNVTAAIKSNYGMGKVIAQDPELSQFSALLVKAGFLVARQLDPITRDTIPNLKFLAEADYWTGLIPTNAAMTEYLLTNKIPVDKDSLKRFLTYHFIRKSVIFDDGKLSGTFPTERTEVTATETTYSTLKITNTLDNMSVDDQSGQTVIVDHAKADILVRKGVVHKINKVLLFSKKV